MPRDLAAAVRANVTALRKERGWSQDTLADRAGITGGAISLIEDTRKLRDLKLATLASLAKALQVTPEYLLAPHTEEQMREAAERPVLTAAEQTLLTRWRSLTLVEQGRLDTYIDTLLERRTEPGRK